MTAGQLRRMAMACGLAGVVAVAACSASQTNLGAGSSRQTRSAAAGPGRAPAVPATVAGYYAQKLRWTPCDNGFQCARLLVPFDYARPAWRRFSLPVIRLPAAGPGRRIGSLVLNPGGPGGSGVQYTLQARSVVSAAVRARFDVVGFDPRGVGGSQPAVRCMTGPQLDKYFETSDTPRNAAELTAVITESRFFAAQCARNAGPLLPYVGTRSAARDLDVLRAALGDARLTYLGKSYGTYLGAWYAQLFPHRVRALVLDGALDPGTSSLSVDIVQAQGFEVALRSFIASCLRQPGCPLGPGGNVSASLVKLQDLINRATRTPLANDLGDGRPANGALLLQGIAASLYSKTYWPELRTGLQDAFAGDGTILVQLGDLLLERSSNGSYSNLVDSNVAINCLDRPWPRALPAWQAAASTATRLAPQFGQAIVWNSLACAYWPVRSYPLPRITASGAPPILVVGTTRDPATPYRWAQALAHELKRGVLLGWNGDGHTAYMMGSGCVDHAVDSYLTSGTLPRSGTVCS